jgi:acyl-CoA thioester hydrolase
MSAFNWKVRVYYEDTDTGGIVYYANYLKFFERARTEWLRALGISQQQLADEQAIMFVVKTATIDYRAPARLDDELTIGVTLEKSGPASLDFVQTAWRGEQALASARVLVACVKRDNLRPCKIPAAITSALANSLANPVASQSVPQNASP